MRDADIEYNELMVAAQHESRLKRLGICTHGWTQGANPVHAPHLKAGQVQCKECGKVFASETDLNDERNERLI